MQVATHGASGGRQKPAASAVHQPCPNTDPGLAGETGVSGDWSTVYGFDGLKAGGGIEGVRSNICPWNPPPVMWPLWKLPPAWTPLLPRSAANGCTASVVSNVTMANRIIALR